MKYSDKPYWSGSIPRRHTTTETIHVEVVTITSYAWYQVNHAYILNVSNSSSKDNVYFVHVVLRNQVWISDMKQRISLAMDSLLRERGINRQLQPATAVWWHWKVECSFTSSRWTRRSTFWAVGQHWRSEIVLVLAHVTVPRPSVSTDLHVILFLATLLDSIGTSNVSRRSPNYLSKVGILGVTCCEKSACNIRSTKKESL